MYWGHILTFPSEDRTTFYGCTWFVQKCSWLQGKGGTFISHFRSLSIGPYPGIKPVTCCSTVKHSDLSTVKPAPVKLGNSTDQGCQLPTSSNIEYWWGRDMIDDVMSHGIWRHLCKKYSLTLIDIYTTENSSYLATLVVFSLGRLTSWTFFLGFVYKPSFTS